MGIKFPLEFAVDSRVATSETIVTRSSCAPAGADLPVIPATAKASSSGVFVPIPQIL
jgi:hypothetical protein